VRQKHATKKHIQRMHRGWFKRKLVENGAPEDITDHQVSRSAGFKDSERAYVAGWQTGVEVQEDFFEPGQ